MSKLESGLKEWVSLGLIGVDQAQQIRQHEAAKPESSWILSGLLLLGAIIVGIGVISLIAANWDQIPDALKLTGDFVLLIALAFGIVHSWDAKKLIQFEVLLVTFLVFCLASIGLISQVYHTGGKLYQALMLWSAITFAAALAARQIFVPFLWAGAFLTGVVYTALDSVALNSVFQKNYQAVFMAVPLLCAGLTVFSKTMAGETGPTRAFRWWTLIAGLVALFASELHHFVKGGLHQGVMAYVTGYVLAAFAAFAIWQSLEYRKTQKILLLATLGIFLIPFHLPLFEIKTSIAYASCTIAVLGLIAIFLASMQVRRLFQWFLFLVGLRVLVLYFEAFGGLALTGFGLIISGGLVIAMAIGWNKYRTQIAVWAEGWAK